MTANLIPFIVSFYNKQSFLGVPAQTIQNLLDVHCWTASYSNIQMHVLPYGTDSSFLLLCVVRNQVPTERASVSSEFAKCVCEDELKVESRMWREGDHIDLGHVDIVVTQCLHVSVKILCSRFCHFLIVLLCFDIFDKNSKWNYLKKLLSIAKIWILECSILHGPLPVNPVSYD